MTLFGRLTRFANITHAQLQKITLLELFFCTEETPHNYDICEMVVSNGSKAQGRRRKQGR